MSGSGDGGYRRTWDASGSPGRTARARADRRAPALESDDHEVVFDVVTDLQRVLRRVPGGARRHLPCAEPDHGAHRPLRLRQDDGPALPEPDERPDRGRADRGQAPVPRRRPVRRARSTRSRSDAGSGWSSRSPTRSRSRSTTTSRSGRRSPGSRANMDELVERVARARRRCGTR